MHGAHDSCDSLSRMFPLEALRAGLGYLKRNPTEVLYAARHAAGFRVTLPLDALRWLASRAKGKKAPRDVVIGAKPPALTVGATIDLMGNPVRVQTAIRVEELRLGPEELRVTLRLSDFSIGALDPNSPAQQLFNAIDKSKPANLVNFLPKRSPALVEAKDDLLVLDLMKLPKIAENPQVKRALGVITPVLVIREIATQDDHLLVSWMPRPQGLTAAVQALRS